MSARKSVQSADAGKLDPKTSGSNIRVSQLIGANLRNDAGDSVGEINDLVLDKRYGVDRMRDRNRGNADIDVNVDRNGVDVDVNRDK